MSIETVGAYTWETPRCILRYSLNIVDGDKMSANFIHSKDAIEEINKNAGKRISVIRATGKLAYDIENDIVTRASLGLTAPPRGYRSKRGE